MNPSEILTLVLLAAQTVQKMIDEGRAQTTAEETAALVDVLNRRAAVDAEFDKLRGQ